MCEVGKNLLATKGILSQLRSDLILITLTEKSERIVHRFETFPIGNGDETGARR